MTVLQVELICWMLYDAMLHAETEGVSRHLGLLDDDYMRRAMQKIMEAGSWTVAALSMVGTHCLR